MQIDDSIISTVLSPINVHLGASHTYDAPATAQVRTSRMSPIASAVLPGSPGERAVKSRYFLAGWRNDTSISKQSDR